MSEISIRMLSQQTSQVLARVRQGEEITVTHRGVVIARIVPAQPGPLDRLITSGRVAPARSRGPTPRPRMPRCDGDEESGALLARLRAEERY